MNVRRPLNIIRLWQRYGPLFWLGLFMLCVFSTGYIVSSFRSQSQLEALLEDASVQVFTAQIKTEFSENQREALSGKTHVMEEALEELQDDPLCRAASMRVKR